MKPANRSVESNITGGIRFSSRGFEVATEYRAVTLDGKLKIELRKLSLSQAFSSSKNLKDLAAAWIQHIKQQFREQAVPLDTRLDLDSTAPYVAPAALVASIVERSGIPLDRPLRVLILASDPLIRIDDAAWASLAGDLLGHPGLIEVVLCVAVEAPSAFSPIAKTLRLPSATVSDHVAVRAGGSAAVDLAIWLHPANETLESIEVDMADTAVALAHAGVPTFAAVFNLADLHSQNYLLDDRAVILEPIGGEVRRGSPAINRFGIATAGAGVEGGWGAILSQLKPCSPTLSREEVLLAKTALRLRNIEGGLHNSWQFGQRINGVAFNRIIPLGLLGNMALDPATGHVLIEDFATKELRLSGHLWASKLKTIPANDVQKLLLWACDVRLCFQMDLPMEEKKRAEARELLEEAFAGGLIAAGIALARSYELSNTEYGMEKAAALYMEVGEQHPLSAYFLAHQAAEQGSSAEAERLMRVSASFGYPLAQTDLGKILFTSERGSEALPLFRAADAVGDVDAAFVLGELNVQAGRFMDALTHLRKAWTYGHAGAVELAIQVAQHMLSIGEGKRSLVKRELREAQDCLNKLNRRSDAQMQMKAQSEA